MGNLSIFSANKDFFKGHLKLVVVWFSLMMRHSCIIAAVFNELLLARFKSEVHVRTCNLMWFALDVYQQEAETIKNA